MLDDAKRTHLSLNWNGLPIEESIGIATLRIDLHSFRDVLGTDIIEPITCELENATRIIRAAARGSTGWRSLAIKTSHLPAVVIEASHLRPRDWIELDLIFTQSEPIAPRVEVVGRVHDGAIVRHIDYLERWNSAFLIVGIVCFVLSIAVNAMYSKLTMLPNELLIETREVLEYWWIWWFPFMATTSSVRSLARKLWAMLPSAKPIESTQSRVELEVEAAPSLVPGAGSPVSIVASDSAEK